MSAKFSDCRRYRYSLTRRWKEPSGLPRRVAFIGLNPSTADEIEDDPTIRRCISFAKAWGFDELVMLNLFGWRATDPRELKRTDDPIGASNDYNILCETLGCEVVVAAWGVHGAYLERDAAVGRLVRKLHALRVTKGGHPAHPLYLPSHLSPLPWTPPPPWEPPP